MTAAPVYDINLWLNGEKLDNETWNQNGRVQVSFSGSLMEEISREADQLQVVWVKDDVLSRRHTPENMVEQVRGTKRTLEEDESIPELSWMAEHFTKYSPVGIVLANTENKSFQIEELLYADQPVLKFRDSRGVEIPVRIDPDTNAVRLANGDPLPRNIQLWMSMTYGLENSSVAAERGYAVQPGDTFTYQYPVNLKFNFTDFDVKSGDEIIGSGKIEAGAMTITITKANIGLNFKGSVAVGAAIDWLEVGTEEKTVSVKVGDIEYILEFEPVEPVKKYNVTVKKTYDDKAYDPGLEEDQDEQGDVKYDPETGLPSAIRYHIALEADKDNSGPLVFSRNDVYLHDTFSSTYLNKAYFDLNSLKITGNNMADAADNTIEKAEFYKFRQGVNYERIYLMDKSGEYASLLPGQKVTMSYWLILPKEVWEQSITGDIEKDYANSSINLDNWIRVRRDGENIAEDKISFTKIYHWFMKSGEVVLDYPHSDGVGPAVRYYVFVNPDALNIGRWTVKDTLDSSQAYAGSVNVYAFESKDAYKGTSSLDDVHKVGEAEIEGITWSYTIPENRGTDYYVFEYYTKVTEPTDKALELANRVELIPPNGMELGSGGIVIPYYTFSLTKDNMTTRMSGKTPVLDINWDTFGEIRWKSVISGYLKGDAEDAEIPSGSVYTDEISVIEKGSNAELTQLLKYHTFHDADSSTPAEKDCKLTVTDGNGVLIGEADYTLAMAQGDEARSFTLTFNKTVAAPVTLEYSTYVTDFNQFGDLEVLFKNEAAFGWGGAWWTADAYHPYSRGYYLDKKVENVDANTGIVNWNLIVNSGYNQWRKQDLTKHKVDIIEEIPEGMVLVDITYNGVLLNDTGDDAEYEQAGRQVIIHLNKIKGFELGNTQTLVVKTRVADLSRKIKAFENRATMVIDGNHLSEAKAKAELETSLLEKGMKYDSKTAPTAIYTLQINKMGAKISNLSGGFIEVYDRLISDKISYVSLDTKFTITNARTGLPIEQAKRIMDADGRGFRVINLPDETPIIITYEVALSGNVGDEVLARNTAELRYSHEETLKVIHEERVVLKVPMATGEGTPYIVIHKTDQDGKSLEGAEFTLYKMVKDGSAWKTGDVVAIYRPEGVRAEAFLQDLEEGQIYYLKETKAPEGYSGDSEIYFTIPGENAVTDYPEGTILCYTGFDYTFINIRDSFFGGRKVLTGRDLLDGEFTFDVYEGERLITTGKNRADGMIIFEDIVYEESDLGIHEYTVQERIENLSSVTYDRTVYTIKMMVKKIGSKIIYEVVSITDENGNTADEIVFNNVYSYNPPNEDDEGGGGGGSSSRSYTTIVEEAVPMAPLPNLEPDVTILEENAPLSGLPKTGGRRVNFNLLMFIGSMLAGAYIMIRRKQDE